MVGGLSGGVWPNAGSTLNQQDDKLKDTRRGVNLPDGSGADAG